VLWYHRLPESWKKMSDIRSDKPWKSVGPKQNLSDQIKLIKIKEKLVLVFLRHFLVLIFFAVKIGTFRTAHFQLLPVIHQHFMVLLQYFIKFCLKSILFILLLLFCTLLWRRFSIFPRFGTFSDAILYTCGLDKSRTVWLIRNKKSSDLIKIYRTCPSDRRISGSLISRSDNSLHV
jgi:hypothetical protein